MSTILVPAPYLSSECKQKQNRADVDVDFINRKNVRAFHTILSKPSSVDAKLFIFYLKNGGT